MVTRTLSPIVDALNLDSYQYLAQQAPELLAAIEAEIDNGKTSEQIARIIATHIGPERHALVIRSQQAAAYIENRMKR